MTKRTQNRLARYGGLDIVAMIEGVLKEATPGAPIAKWAREELVARYANGSAS